MDSLHEMLLSLRTINYILQGKINALLTILNSLQNEHGLHRPCLISINY